MSDALSLKRIIIKQELVELTGHYILAIMLNQFLYWSERTRDIDQYIQEECERAEINFEPTHGWIYKKAEQLNDEIMLGLSVASIRKYLKILVQNGWLLERRNPLYRWDKTYQYRPDILKIMRDLGELGYALDGYKIADEVLNSKIRISKSKIRNDKNYNAIPDINTKITNKDNNAGSKLPESKPSNPRKRKRDERLDHPAIRAYRHEARLNIPITWRDVVISKVENDTDKWASHIHDWIGSGYNPANIKGILESYINGGLKKRANGNVSGSATTVSQLLDDGYTIVGVTNNDRQTTI